MNKPDSSRPAGREDSSAAIAAPEGRKPGGLYRNVKMSVGTANILVAVGAVALILAMVLLVANNGFTVDFDTDGGSHVEACRVMYGETVPVAVEPVKEGWVFTGWYIDRACTTGWDVASNTVSGSMTLYAGWAQPDAAQNG